MVGLERREAATKASPSAWALARHAAWNNAALVLQLLGALALVALAFRRLPAAEVGIFSLTAVTAGLVQILDPSAGYVMSRIVAGQEQTGDDEVLAQVQAGLRTIAYVLAGATGAFVLAAAVSGFPGLGSSRVVMIAGICLATCVQLASAPLAAVALGLGDYRRLFVASGLTAVVTLATAWLLLPSTGVAALGIALLAGQVAGRGFLYVRRQPARSQARSHIPPGPAAVGELWRHSGSVYLSSLAAQVLAVSDLWTVGALRGADATAAYRAGSMMPTQASALFYRVYDVLYPRLPRIREAERQERTIALATRVFCAAAGCMFTALFLERDTLTHLLVGRSDVLTGRVFAFFCAIWLINVPIHGLALLLISRSQNRVMTPVVLAEAAVNVVASVVLVVLIGPIGAAVGTLATMAISNLVVVPWVVSRIVPGAFGLTWSGAACCLIGIGAGAAIQSPVAVSTRGFPGLVAVALAGLVSLAPAVFLAAGRQGRQVLRAHV
jgi:O-antigen/teichoic acid export membrane protein